MSTTKTKETATNNIKLDVRVYPLSDPTSSTLAFASVTIADVFAVRNIRVLAGENGLFVSMPNRRDNNGEFKDICFPVTANFRTQMIEAILSKYKEKEKTSIKEALSEKPKEEKTPKSEKTEKPEKVPVQEVR